MSCLGAQKPLMTVAAYTCEQCGYELYQPIENKTFMPLQTCQGPMCVTNRVNGRIHLQTRASKLVKFQEIKVRELANQVPKGQVPRHITVCAWGELTRLCKPGDTVMITGIFLPTPFTGFRGNVQASRALIADTYIKATDIQQEKKSAGDCTGISVEMREQIEELAGLPDTYASLARSIAPEIYGHEDVKKALLLQLVGGAPLKLKDGVRSPPCSRQRRWPVSSRARYAAWQCVWPVDLNGRRHRCASAVTYTCA